MQMHVSIQLAVILITCMVGGGKLADPGEHNACMHMPLEVLLVLVLVLFYFKNKS
jgi:hypothetical protein